MTLLDLVDPAFALVDPNHPRGPRPLLYTFAMDPETTLRRYADPEGHHGLDAHVAGRELAYRRGLAVGTWDRPGLVAAARSVVAVHAPTGAEPAP